MFKQGGSILDYNDYLFGHMTTHNRSKRVGSLGGMPNLAANRWQKDRLCFLEVLTGNIS